MYRSILNSKKIKYNILKELVQPYLNDVDEISCFLSLNSVLKTFYSLKPDQVAESLDVSPQNALSSEIINIIAHYRHFFWSRYGISSNYYIYYSDEMCNYCTSINIDYKKDYYEKRMGMSDVKEYITINGVIEQNLGLIEILTEYLPNIYFINTKSFEPSALPQLIIDKNKPKKNCHNFILTNDQIDYQLCNNPFTTVISLNSDHSKVISTNNLISNFIKKSKTISVSSNKLDSNFFVPILSISGYKKYNINGLKGYGTVKVVKELNKLLLEDKISNIKYSSMDELIPLFKYAKTLNDNFKILSLKNISNNISNLEFINIKKQFTNKSDNLSLMDINAKYYESNPLMLIELMEGEE